jgi:hypothetical protein
LSVIRIWVIPFAVMAIAGVALDTFLHAKGVSPAGYFAAITLFATICGAYVAYGVGREEHPQPIRRALRKSREARQ